MNNRHIQTFLTVSAAFFAMSAPLYSSANSSTATGGCSRTAQHLLTTGTNVAGSRAEKSGQRS